MRNTGAGKVTILKITAGIVATFVVLALLITLVIALRPVAGQACLPGQSPAVDSGDHLRTLLVCSVGEWHLARHQ
jgi:hypothetical protein